MRICLILLALLPGLVIATPLTPQDFAYALPLELDGDGAIYRLSLPAEVYRNTHRRDLGDIRVFNGHAQVVPHLFKQAPPVLAEPPLSAPLPLFALDKLHQPEGEMMLQIRSDGFGTVVDLRSLEAGRYAQTASAYYLIDASGLEGALEALRLQWPVSEVNFIHELELEVSDDLQHWRAIPGSHQLANLRHEGETILHNTLQLAGLEARYLRLSWPLERYELPLQVARLVLRAPELEQPLAWMELEAELTEQAGEYLFDSGGHFPLERMALLLPEDNTVVHVELDSRADADAPWRKRYSGLVYRLGESGSLPVGLSVNSDRYWRLRVDQSGGGLGAGLPGLRLAWQPQQLHFVARGETPFMLAYGAFGVDAQQVAGSRLMQQLLDIQQETLIKPARHGEAYVLGGASRLQPPAAPLPWRQWLLWTVLVLGVLLLLLMARQLARQVTPG